MDLGKQTVHELLAGLSAKQPTPGGGTVAGVLAALSASLGQMVLAYTDGKKNYSEHAELHNLTVSLLQTASEQALELGNKDAQAYSALHELWQLDKNDPKRIEAWDEALANAIQIPMNIISMCNHLIVVLQELVGKTNAMLSSDLVIAAILAESAARCAFLNVEINARELDNTKKAEILAEAGALVSACKGICASIENSCDV